MLNLQFNFCNLQVSEFVLPQCLEFVCNKIVAVKYCKQVLLSINVKL